MNDSQEYGKVIYRMNFGEALSAKPKVISDYKIVTIEVPEERIKKLIEQLSLNLS